MISVESIHGLKPPYILAAAGQPHKVKCAMRSLYEGISDDKSRISQAEKQPLYFGLDFVGASVHEASNVRPCHQQTLTACTVSAFFQFFR